MFDDLIRFHTPEGKRAAQAEGGIEHYLDEGAVMVAFAMHLLRTVTDLKHVAIAAGSGLRTHQAEGHHALRRHVRVGR